MNHSSSIVKISPTFIPLAAVAIHHYQPAWKTGQFRVPPGFGPGGGAPHKCNTRNIDRVVNNACTDVFCALNIDFSFATPEVQARKIEIACIMIHGKIHSLGMDPAMAQPYNDESSINQDFVD